MCGSSSSIISPRFFALVCLGLDSPGACLASGQLRGAHRKQNQGWKINTAQQVFITFQKASPAALFLGDIVLATHLNKPDVLSMGMFCTAGFLFFFSALIGNFPGIYLCQCLLLMCHEQPRPYFCSLFPGLLTKSEVKKKL